MQRMSNFVLDSVTTAGRVGMWAVSESNAIPTPAFLIHTLGGSVPHLTPDVLQHVFPPTLATPPPLLVSVDTCLTFVKALTEFCSLSCGTASNNGNGIAKFAGLSQFPVFLSPHNSSIALHSGYNSGEGVAVWGRRGKHTLPVDEYTKLLGSFKPRFFQALSDYDICSSSSIKRLKKSTTRTLEYLDAHVSTPPSSDAGRSGGKLFATLEMGWFVLNEEEATKTLKTMLADKRHLIDGFVISGVAYSPTPKDTKQKQKPLRNSSDLYLVKDIDYTTICTIVGLLPPELPRYIPGPFRSDQILELILRGVDLFDSSWVTASANLGEALVLDELLKHFPIPGEHLPTNEENLQSNDDNDDTDATSQGCIISLKDKKYFSDFTPLSHRCSCYTCRKHTKAYLNHLYATDELLGPVLVMIHNLTSFTCMMRTIQSVIKKQAELNVTNNNRDIQILKQCLAASSSS